MIYNFSQIDRMTLLKTLKYAYVGKSECQTMEDYLSQYFYLDAPYDSVEIPDNILEIISDEMNHCIISIFSIAELLGIKIPTDNFPEDIPLK